MTVEHRFIVGLMDIKRVIFECKHENCHARLSLRPEEIRNRPVSACPSCNREWLSGEIMRAMDVYKSPLSNFVRALDLSRATDGDANVRILLEFDEPKL